jgi:cyclophilin family peptidyl-prolyl cis-trans isomerase
MKIKETQYMVKLFLLLTLLLVFISCLDSLGDKEPLIESQIKNHEQSLRLKTVHGDIIIKLFPTKAPSTVERITFLISKGFYNGLSFHKVIPNFIIQTGDPLNTGEGGSGQKLILEKSDLKQKVGSVSIARQLSDPNSGDSQFFICVDSCEEVEDEYTIFGQVTSGIEYVRKIQEKDKIINLSLD